MNKTVLVFDGNSILNRAFFGIRSLTAPDGFPTNALYGYINIVSRQIEDVAPDYCAVAFDVHAPTFRHKMFTDYKSGRHPTPEELLMQMPVAHDISRALGMKVLELEGYEADDILGTIAAMAEENGDRAYVMTGDRDSLQLISDKTHVLLATNTETVDYSPEVFAAEYGVSSTQFVDVKALMGDSSDAIPGVAGIGKKTALSLIAKYGSLESLYEALPTDTFTPSVRTKLETGKDNAFFSRILSTIKRDVPLAVTLEDIAYTGMDRAACASYFIRLGFAVFVKRFGLSAAAPAVLSDDHSDVPPVKEAVAVEERAVRTLGENEDYQTVSDTVALMAEGENLLLFDGENMTLLPMKHTSVPSVLNEKKTVCYDAKTLYKQLRANGISFAKASFDVMLAAYVLDAGASDFSCAGIASRFGFAPGQSASSTLETVWNLVPILREKLNETEQTRVFEEIEMPLAAVLTDMEQEGFCIDREGIADYGKKLDQVSEELVGRIYFYAGGEFNIRSTKQLGTVLFDTLGLPPSKKTKTGYSTDVEVLEKLRFAHPIIEDLLDYRQIDKLKSTYVEGLLKVADGNGTIHTTFKQTGTATGRLSSAEPNLQNIPIRTDLGRELRRYFIPSAPGRLLIDADYSQIELRLLAHISGDSHMIEAFKSGQDIHTSTASAVFGVPMEKVTSDLRKKAKAVNFGILYGMGEFSLAEDLGISRVQAKKYIDEYLASYPGISSYLDGVKEEGHEKGFVTTVFGRRRYIPELQAKNKNLVHFGERVAMNSPIQGTAADIIKIAMIRVSERLRRENLDAKLILQVHDELLIDASPSCAEQARRVLTEEMENAMVCRVPLTVGISEGATWYESK